MTLHVLHVVDALALGGAERMVVEIANRTVADGHRVSVCVTRSEQTLAPRLDPRVELIVLGRKRRFEVRPLARLVRWCRANAVDVIHCHGRSSFSLLALLEALRALRTPVVFHDHRGVQMYRAVPRWFSVAQRFLSAYVAVDTAQLEWARSGGVPAARMHVIGNALDFNELERRPVTGTPLAAQAGKQRVIAVGSLRAEKAIDVLLDAFARVTQPAVLHLVGGDADPAYAAKCRARALQPDLVGRVVFEGQREDALPLARTADIAVHAARSESGPLVLAEYAGLGIPFVATRVGGIAAALEATRPTGFVPPDDAVALAAALDELLASPAMERAALVARTRDHAVRLFSIGAVMPRWYEIYDQVMR